MRYSKDNGEWQNWKRRLTDDNKYTYVNQYLDADLTGENYKQGLTISNAANAEGSNWPENRAGSTLNFKDHDGIYQLFTPRGRTTLYLRKNQNNNGWEDWEKISGNHTMSASSRQNMRTQDLSIGDSVFDTTLNQPVWVKSINLIKWIDANGDTVSKM